MNMLDNHVHTTFSRDGKDNMETVIKRGIDLGVSHLTFTDHMEYNDGEFSIDFEKYCKTIQEYKEKYKSYININTGIEVGYQKHLKKDIETIINYYPFDFILCSTHTVDKIDVPSPKFFEGYSKEEAYRKYFESILDTVSNFNDFDVYGHLDYVIRYGNYKDSKGKKINKIIYNDYRDVLDAILQRIIYNDKGIELNTSGIRYNIGAMHPNRSILKRYRELGGYIITMGSDSHKARDVCKDFNIAYELLRYLDFKRVCTFKDREPIFMSIEKSKEIIA